MPFVAHTTYSPYVFTAKNANQHLIIVHIKNIKIYRSLLLNIPLAGLKNTRRPVYSMVFSLDRERIYLFAPYENFSYRNSVCHRKLGTVPTIEPSPIRSGFTDQN